MGVCDFRQVIGECVDAGVKSAVVISAGFRERGQEGAALEAKVQERLCRGAMRLIGPNSAELHAFLDEEPTGPRADTVRKEMAATEARNR